MEGQQGRPVWQKHSEKGRECQGMNAQGRRGQLKENYAAGKKLRFHFKGNGKPLESKLGIYMVSSVAV